MFALHRRIVPHSHYQIRDNLSNEIFTRLSKTKSNKIPHSLERLLARVDSLMFDEAGFPRKAFAASLAAEWLNFGVLQLMNSQIALHAKGFPACTGEKG